MSSSGGSVSRNCIFDVVRVFNDNLADCTDQCIAASEAMKILEQIYGSESKREVQIALRYAEAIRDQEAMEVFSVIRNCMDASRSSFYVDRCVEDQKRFEGEGVSPTE